MALRVILRLITADQPTIRDVAQNAGVSTATGSKVLQERAIVAEAMLARVQRAVAECGFIRNEHASKHSKEKQAGT